MSDAEGDYIDQEVFVVNIDGKFQCPLLNRDE